MKAPQPLPANRLLRNAARAEGFVTIAALLEHYVLEGCVPGVCTACGLAISPSCEPDAEDFSCDVCETPTVKSILIVAGLV